MIRFDVSADRGVKMQPDRFSLEFLDTAFKFTRTLVDRGDVTWPDAKCGLIKIMDDLTTHQPELKFILRSKMKSFIAFQDQSDHTEYPNAC
jgi:hypothetical protein